jgi:hypothetical protein
MRPERARRLADDRADQEPQRVRAEHRREGIGHHDDARAFAAPGIEAWSAGSARDDGPNVRLLEAKLDGYPVDAAAS